MGWFICSCEFCVSWAVVIVMAIYLLGWVTFYSGEIFGGLIRLSLWAEVFNKTSFSFPSADTLFKRMMTA